MRAEFYWISFAVSLCFVGSILYLIRGRKLREQYSLLWLLLGMAMTIISLFPQLLDRVAARIHIVYAPSLLYFIGLMGVLFILLHLTIAISSLAQKLITLTQSVALRQERMHRLEQRIEQLEREALAHSPGKEVL